jgi:hypothetical protein
MIIAVGGYNTMDSLSGNETISGGCVGYNTILAGTQYDYAQTRRIDPHQRATQHDRRRRRQFHDLQFVRRHDHQSGRRQRQPEVLCMDRGVGRETPNPICVHPTRTESGGPNKAAIGEFTRAMGDLGYRGKRLAEAGQALGITVEAIARRDGQFIPAGICWVVERSFAWLRSYRATGEEMAPLPQ